MSGLIFIKLIMIDIDLFLFSFFKIFIVFSTNGMSSISINAYIICICMIRFES